MSGSRPRALPPEATPALRKKGRMEVNKSHDLPAPREGGEVRKWHDLSAPSEEEEVRKSHDLLAPSEEGEVRKSHDLLAPREGGEARDSQGQRTYGKGEREPFAKAYKGPAANREWSSGAAKSERIDPELLKSILDTAMSMFAPDEALPRDTLEELAKEAIASADGNYGIKEAVDRDMRLFRAAQLDFSAMVRMRLKKIGATRMSAYRVEQLRADNPERARLFDIASGMRVPLPAGLHHCDRRT